MKTLMKNLPLMIFQYLPAASVYGLNAINKGKHKFQDRSIISNFLFINDGF
jgi:hypothetical protein